MKQRKFCRLLLILFAMLYLAGCGRKEDEEAPEDAPEEVLAANQQYSLSGLGYNGNGSILLGDILYYPDSLGGGADTEQSKPSL